MDRDCNYASCEDLDCPIHGRVVAALGVLANDTEGEQ